MPPSRENPVAAVLAAVLALSGCAANATNLPPPPEQPPIEPGENPSCASCSPRLDEAALLLLESRAMKGDAHAAMSLSEYFRAEGDTERSAKWELHAAELGHPWAQYGQWIRLRHTQHCDDQERALAWLEKAAAGSTPARENLPAYRQQVRSVCRKAD